MPQVRFVAVLLVASALCVFVEDADAISKFIHFEYPPGTPRQNRHCVAPYRAIKWPFCTNIESHRDGWRWKGDGKSLGILFRERNCGMIYIDSFDEADFEVEMGQENTRMLLGSEKHCDEPFGYESIAIIPFRLLRKQLKAKQDAVDAANRAQINEVANEIPGLTDTDRYTKHDTIYYWRPGVQRVYVPGGAGSGKRK